MGGTQTYLLRLVEGMRRVAPQHDYVLFLNEEGAAVRAPEFEGLEVDVCPLTGRVRPLRLLWEHTRLQARARSQNVDLLHSLGYIGPSHLSMPGVVTVLDLVHYHYPRQISFGKRTLWRWLFPRSLATAKHIVTISESVAADLQLLFPETRGRVTAVPLGVDAVTYPLADAGSRAGAQRYLLAVASPAPHKNLVTVLRALELLAGERPSLLLKVAGMRTSTTDHLGRVARELGIAERVEFTGHVDNTALDALYRGAAAMIFPSLYEGFGLPPLEAMARGCPVIASDRPAVPEVVGDAALTFSAENPQALASAIRAVLDDPALRGRLRASGLARAQVFNWDATARGTLGVYERVLASR
jgi:glycosyltransferase involved in cell wall biosynthesis